MQTTIIERPDWIKKNNTHTYKRKQKVLKLEVKNLSFFFSQEEKYQFVNGIVQPQQKEIEFFQILLLQFGL